MQTAIFPSAAIAEFYRFAVLLAGNARDAERVMAEVLAEVDGHCSQLRSDKTRRAWFVGRIRAKCPGGAHDPAAPRLLREDAGEFGKLDLLDIEAFLLAQRFHILPEPERSALALFYLDSFSTSEIAQLLKLDVPQLADALGRARELLGESLRAVKGAVPA